MSDQQIKDDLIEDIESFDFISDEKMAKKILQFVLGIMTSNLSDQETKWFTSELPDYLNFEALRSHQTKITDRSPSETVLAVAERFDLEEEQAREMVLKILDIAKKQAPHEIERVAFELNEKWKNAIEEA